MSTLDDLFAALVSLRDSDDPLDRRHDLAWRVIEAHLRATYPGSSADAEEARQEALIAIARGVRAMEAKAPLQAAKWIATIHRRKVVDGIRARRRDPARIGLERAGEDEGPSAVERLHSEDRRELAPDAIARVVARVEDEVDALLAETERSPASRQLLRMQARAALHRLVLEADFDEIVRVLDSAQELGRDRVYKWVERGRTTVLAALDRWSGRAREGSAEADVAAALREIVQARRSDAGKPRPGRRKGGPA